MKLTFLILGLTILTSLGKTTGGLAKGDAVRTSVTAAAAAAAADESVAAAAAIEAASVVSRLRHPNPRRRKDTLGVDQDASKTIDTLAESIRSRRRKRGVRRRSSRSSTSSLTITSDRSTYHSNADLVAVMEALSTLYPNHTHVYSIGESVRGTPLTVIAIAGRDPDRHVTLRPEVKFVGNMHGNEVVGRELIVRYAEYLLRNYESSPRVRNLLDKVRVHLMPTMNPDGFADAQLGDCRGVQGRNNANANDLNRNFPDYFNAFHDPPRQPETQSVMNWATDTQFVISANLHGGAVVANYPFDNNKDSAYSYSTSPDDDVFRDLATTYARHNEPMKTSREFPNGITNGAAWYPLPGGMQDWMYVVAGCMELTIEISDCKYPPFSVVDDFWRDNRDSMTALLYRVFVGVKGRIFVRRDVAGEDTSEPVANARVSVIGRPNIVFSTTVGGEFWRLLTPGKYGLKFEADCCHPTFLNVTVPPRPTSSRTSSSDEDFDVNAANVVVDVFMTSEKNTSETVVTDAVAAILDDIIVPHRGRGTSLRRGFFLRTIQYLNLGFVGAVVMRISQSR